MSSASRTGSASETASRARRGTSHLKRLGGTAGLGMADSCRPDRARRTCTFASRGRSIASTSRLL